MNRVKLIKMFILGIGLGFMWFVSVNASSLIYFLGCFGGGIVGIIVMNEINVRTRYN